MAKLKFDLLLFSFYKKTGNKMQNDEKYKKL